MRFTVEEEQFLIENASEHSSAELAEMMNNKFGTARTASQVLEKCCKSLHVHVKNKTQYGLKPKEQLPIGTIRSGNNGNTYIKVKDVPIKTRATGYAKPNWIPLQEKIYTDIHGDIPKGYMVCFLDCDRTNFEPTNLHAINRKISAILAKNKWWSSDPVVTMAAIKWCELHYAAKGGREQ